MTHAPRPEHLATAARIARAEGVEVSIQIGDRLYRFIPPSQAEAEPADPFASRSLKK